MVKASRRAPIVARDDLPTARWPAASVSMRMVAALLPYARNSRTHSDAQVAQIVASIKEFGWTVPILVAEDGTIIAGHGRVLAAQQLGIEQVPAMVAVGWTEVQRRAYTIADNKLAENAGWDEDLLRIELADLQALEFNMDTTGFSEREIAGLLGAGTFGNTDPDDVPDEPAVPVSQPGDIWVLGAHRVICGSSTELATVETLMAGILADACWTDPPYNVNYESALAGKIQNDSMGSSAFRSFLLDAFTCAAFSMKPGASIYVAHADTEGLNFRGAFADAGFKLSGCLVWAKDSLVLGRSDYQWQHEPILYGWKPGAAHRWFGERKQTTLLQVEGGAYTKNSNGTVSVRIGAEVLVISGTDLVATSSETTIIRCEKPKRSADHPTMKPVELIARMLRNSSARGDVVLDLFGGSGSTLIACEMLGRQARLVELETKFVDVIVRRWMDFAGEVARLESTGETYAQTAKKRRSNV
jgi:DNA modification methylase